MKPNRAKRRWMLQEHTMLLHQACPDVREVSDLRVLSTLPDVASCSKIRNKSVPTLFLQKLVPEQLAIGNLQPIKIPTTVQWDHRLPEACMNSSEIQLQSYSQHWWQLKSTKNKQTGSHLGFLLYFRKKHILKGGGVPSPSWWYRHPANQVDHIKH